MAKSRSEVRFVGLLPPETARIEGLRRYVDEQGELGGGGLPVQIFDRKSAFRLVELKTVLEKEVDAELEALKDRASKSEGVQLYGVVGTSAYRIEVRMDPRERAPAHGRGRRRTPEAQAQAGPRRTEDRRRFDRAALAYTVVTKGCCHHRVCFFLFRRFSD